MSCKSIFQIISRLLITGILIFVCGSLPSALAYAQNAPGSSEQQNTIPLDRSLRFERFSLEDGLSQNTVLTLFQDHQGYLWIGTQDGLDRYDGYSFTIFKHDTENADSLNNDAVLSLSEDADGFLWIGTWGGGLDSYDLQSNHFTHYQNNPADPTSLSNDIVTSILVDHKNRLWVGTCGGGLNLMDQKTGQLFNFRHDPENPSSLASDDVSAIFEDADGDLWIGSGCLGNQGAGVDRLRLQNQPIESVPDGTFTHLQGDPNDTGSLSGNNISSIVQDKAGFIWVGTGGYTLKGGGLNRIDPQTGLIERFQHDSGNSSSLRNDDVMNLMVDSSDLLWVATWGGGLDIADTDLEKTRGQLVFSHQQSNPYDIQSISSNLVWSLLEDRSGVFWIGTANGGLDAVNPQVQQFAVFRSNPAVTSSLSYDAVGPILQDRTGRIWVATLGGGLNLFNRQTETFNHYFEPYNNPFSQQANTYIALIEDESGELWAGTLAGMARFDPDTGALTYYRHNNDDPTSIINDNVSSLVEDQSGRLWVGTLGGLDFYDRATNIFTHIDVPELEAVFSMLIGADGYLWVGSWGQGLFRIDLNTLSASKVAYKRFIHDPNDPLSLAENDVVDILQSRNGTLWFGTHGGLEKYNAPTGEFAHFQVKDGLTDNSVLCMQEDNEGNLWISTNNGLSRFDPVQLRFRNFNVNDGLQSNEFDSGACGMSANGELYFGGQKGLNVFFPGAIQDNPTAPPIVITSFSKKNQPVDVDLSGKTPIQLSYTDSFIAFEFVALDFHDPDKNQYMYKLEGFDPDWISAGVRRYASYTNLPGGDYTFQVIASNNNGVWNETGVSIPIKIIPPLWQTWWFQGASLLALLAIGFMGVRWRIDSISAQNRHLEELVDLRTADLKQSNVKLLQAIELREKAETALAQKAAGEAVVAERSRLARDLHDAVTQTLFSASLIAEVLPQLWDIDQKEARKHLNRAAGINARCISRNAHLAFGTAPFSPDGYISTQPAAPAGGSSNRTSQAANSICGRW